MAELQSQVCDVANLERTARRVGSEFCGDSRPLTADREGLADVLARAMADAYDPGLEKAVADALFASGVVRPVADVQAEAWDEGFDAGEADVMNHNKAGWDGDCIPNPYRTPASPEEGKD